MNFEELKRKALSLPAEPGVYIMKDKNDRVIYVGKAKKLKNRVSQYFQDTASHTLKTRQMVSNIDHFDVIVAATEFEALVLECSQIKQYMPKYNILLKDGKGYPYVRLNMKEPYPSVQMVNKPADDGVAYYGPFGSRGMTNGILEAIKLALKLPSCSKKFPRDVGKDRPCLHYHMGQCAGWCQKARTQEEYGTVIEQARQLLLGNYKAVADEIRGNMLCASDELNFELAASLRDRLAAVEMLDRKQLVTAGNKADTDIIGFESTETKSCFAVLHYSGGNLVDKDYEILPVYDDQTSAVSSLVKQYYLGRGFAPKVILLPFEIEDRELFEKLLLQQYGKKTNIKVPLRGDRAKLVALAQKNAREEAERVTQRDERVNATLSMLGKMLMIPPPGRIESFDISNTAGSDIVASMVVFCDGKPRRSEYRRFKIEGLEDQDDYASMRQVITRRFLHMKQDDKGFDAKPDLLLIDGGVVHARTAVEALQALDLKMNVFGMVKDDRHRTRALVTPEGEEIRIDAQQAVFSLIGNIQEETHRFAITFHRQLRSKRLRYSELDAIPGIGPKRKQELLKLYKSLTAIGAADLADLERYLPKDAARAVYEHFQTKRRGESCDASSQREGAGNGSENA